LIAQQSVSANTPPHMEGWYRGRAGLHPCLKGSLKTGPAGSHMAASARRILTAVCVGCFSADQK